MRAAESRNNAILSRTFLPSPLNLIFAFQPSRQWNIMKANEGGDWVRLHH
jgi:hypothetical protein